MGDYDTMHEGLRIGIVELFSFHGPNLELKSAAYIPSKSGMGISFKANTSRHDCA